MLRPTTIARIALATTVALLAGPTLLPARSLSQPQPSQSALVDEVWQILNQEYVDASFNHKDWRAIRQNYLSHSYRSKQQAYAAIREMVAQLGDPYTDFFDPQEYKELDRHISGKLSGIGVELTQNEKTKALTVVALLEGSPAFTAGILTNDVILQIDGKSTHSMSFDDAVRHIQGPVGTQVVLAIQRGNEAQTFKLTRANIDRYPVAYRVQTTPAGKIGYIELPEFTETAAENMQHAIQALEGQQVRGYILDLRSDPGGLLTASLEIAGMWLKQGEIVSLVNRDKATERYEVSGHPLTDKPLIVLVDGGSASASEILAGALQDNARATLLGTRSFGKGLVQSVEPLDDGSALKFTVAKYYTPKGRDINHVGIAPDIAVDLTEAQQKKLTQTHSWGTLADPQYAIAVEKLSRMMVGATHP